MISAAQKVVAFDPPHRARAKSTLAAQVGTRGFPFPGLTFVRDELHPKEGKRQRERVRNFWAVDKEGGYTEGCAAGKLHALELIAVLRKRPTHGDMSTLGAAMREAQRRGRGSDFESGVLIGFCWMLSKALSCPWATMDDLRTIVERAEYARKIAEMEAS